MNSNEQYNFSTSLVMKLGTLCWTRVHELARCNELDPYTWSSCGTITATCTGLMYHTLPYHPLPTNHLSSCKGIRHG